MHHTTGIVWAASRPRGRLKCLEADSGEGILSICGTPSGHNSLGRLRGGGNHMAIQRRGEAGLCIV